jgi:hypothetical protein
MAPAITTVPRVVGALADHIETWINDFLSMVERLDGIPDNEAMPRPASLSLTNQKPSNDALAMPAVILATSGGAPDRAHKIGSVTFQPTQVTIGAVCDGDGESWEDAGNAARLYAQALALLLEVKPALFVDDGTGQRIPGVKVIAIRQPAYADGKDKSGKRMALAQFDVLVDFPYLDSNPDVSSSWEPTPSGDIAPEPQEAPTATSVITTVRQATTS